jgi:putative addiction module component (TIGR02574 family)
MLWLGTVAGGRTMPVNFDDAELQRLSVTERLDLIERIWNSLPEQVEPHDLSDWQLAELAMRRAAAEASPGVGRPWRDVLKEIEEGK